MNTKIKGDLAELVVAADLIKRGFKVAIPYGDNWRYDLLATKDSINFIKLQVKYTKPDNDVLKLRTYSTTYRENKTINHAKYTVEEIDYLVAVNGETLECYYVPANELIVDVIHLRLKKPNNNHVAGIRWASNYANIT